MCWGDIMFRDEPAYTKISKDISDFLGVHGDRWMLSGAVTVCLYHQHQQVAVWYLLHYKHPETMEKKLKELKINRKPLI